jgi:hypothetical protein
MKRSLLLIIAVLVYSTTFAQANNWTKDEQLFYTKMKSLCEHFKGKLYDTTQRKLVFKNFVYFDNILSDTSQSRISQRIALFDGLFYQMTHFIDSVGLENFDAAPTRFYKSNNKFFEPFDIRGELSELLPLTLTYYDKRRPGEPIGTLLFEAKTHKLLAWLMIDQGGYHYFLTFNLI